MAQAQKMQLYDGVTIAGDWANARALQEVVWWDIGPERPIAPKKPALPKVGKSGDPEYDLAKVEFDIELENYKETLLAYERAKKAFALWKSGPVEFTQDSSIAHDTEMNDARAVAEGRQTKRRFYMSASTRGYGNLPNHGLPEGMKPGQGQAEIERRKAEQVADMVAAGQADPVFGKQELRG